MQVKKEVRECYAGQVPIDEADQPADWAGKGRPRYVRKLEPEASKYQIQIDVRQLGEAREVDRRQRWPFDRWEAHAEEELQIRQTNLNLEHMRQ